MEQFTLILLNIVKVIIVNSTIRTYLYNPQNRSYKSVHHRHHSLQFFLRLHLQISFYFQNSIAMCPLLLSVQDWIREYNVIPGPLIL
jgi:hypothetical protein